MDSNEKLRVFELVLRHYNEQDFSRANSGINPIKGTQTNKSKILEVIELTRMVLEFLDSKVDVKSEYDANGKPLFPRDKPIDKPSRHGGIAPYYRTVCGKNHPSEVKQSEIEEISLQELLEFLKNNK